MSEIKVFTWLLIIQFLEVLLDVYSVTTGEAPIVVLANLPICTLIAAVWFTNFDKKTSSGRLFILVVILWKLFSTYLATIGHYYDALHQTSIGFLINPIYLIDLSLWIILFVLIVKNKR